MKTVILFLPIRDYVMKLKVSKNLFQLVNTGYVTPQFALCADFKKTIVNRIHTWQILVKNLGRPIWKYCVVHCNGALVPPYVCPYFRTHNLLVNKHIFKSIVSLDCTKDVARQNSGTNLIQRGANLFFLSFVDNIQNLNVFLTSCHCSFRDN